jgi:hypothetical protein
MVRDFYGYCLVLFFNSIEGMAEKYWRMGRDRTQKIANHKVK